MKRIIISLLTLILLFAVGLSAFACNSTDKTTDTSDDGSLPATLEEAAARLEAAEYTVNVVLGEDVGEVDTRDDTIVGYIEVRKNGNWALDLLLFKSKETAAAYYDKWEDNFRDHSLEGEIYGVIGEWTYSGIPEAFEAFKTPIKE